MDDLHEDVREWCAVADRFRCSYDVSYTEYGEEVRVYQQKITLDDVDMSTLFDGLQTCLMCRCLMPHSEARVVSFLSGLRVMPEHCYEG